MESINCNFSEKISRRVSYQHMFFSKGFQKSDVENPNFLFGESLPVFQSRKFEYVVFCYGWEITQNSDLEYFFEPPSNSVTRSYFRKHGL